MSERPTDLRKRVYCSACGRPTDRRHGLLPLGWQEMPDISGRALALCPDCVRRSLWLIEARLEIDPAGDL